MSEGPLDPRRHAFRADLADARLAGRVSAARFVEGSAAATLWPSAPLRGRPEPSASVTATLLMGQRVRVFDAASGWSWVQRAEDGYVGYAPSDALGPPQDAAPRAMVAALRAPLHPAPDLKSPPSGWAPMGASLALAGERANRYVALLGGAWVFEGHLAAAPAPDWVAVAEAFAGVPYLWGGETAEGLDCSALVQRALAMAQIAAPRDSDQQEQALGRALEADAPLERGDLVFWRGHVGVMRDAHRLLHANAHHMSTATEPLAEAVDRIEAAGAGRPTARRRL